ncbi:unnamed protein product [Ixodes pacificus]
MLRCRVSWFLSCVRVCVFEFVAIPTQTLCEVETKLVASTGLPLRKSKRQERHTTHDFKKKKSKSNSRNATRRNQLRGLTVVLYSCCSYCIASVDFFLLCVTLNRKKKRTCVRESHTERVLRKHQNVSTCDGYIFFQCFYSKYRLMFRSFKVLSVDLCLRPQYGR